MADILGSLKKIDVRSQWANEASNFTPWLAQENNIAELSYSLGIELEVESTEVAVGPYSADILARDSATGDYVIIENQLGKTDHDHLGKSITYASVLNASAVVWIATNFTEEHKKALDWLNDNSSEDVSFYGVSIELWQIDDSKPAVRFNVISRPADFARKSAVTKAGTVLTDVKKLQLEWWTAFRDALIERKILASAQAPRPRYWFNIALGRSGIHLSNIANTYDNKIGIRVYMRSKYNSEAALSQLMEQKEEIEKEIGDQLRWNPNPDARDKIISLLKDADLNKKDKWHEYIDWMIDKTARFRKTFSPRVKMLELDISEEQETNNEEIST